MLPINRHPAARELQRFARIWFPLFVAGAGAVAWWRLDSPGLAIPVWIIGGALVAAALVRTETARLLFVGLQTITYPLGVVVSTVALAILFYGVFTIIGSILRLTGRDPLSLRRRAVESHWVPHTHDDGPRQAFKQF